MRTKVLFTGGSGLLALNWAAAVAGRYDVVLGLHSRKISVPGMVTEAIHLDDTEVLESDIERLNPGIVIHCAALTNVEECEADPSLADRVNVQLAERLATVCRKKNIRFVFISTDHVYSGKQSMRTEDEPVEVLNEYARSKASAEQAVMHIDSSALIIRTNFYGWGTDYRYSFSDFIISNLRKQLPVFLFEDVFYTPILIEELAHTVMELVEKKASGIFNVVGNERLSKYDFGKRVAEVFELDASLIRPDQFAQRKDLVARPFDLSLSNQKTSKLLNRKFAGVTEGIQRLKEQETDRLQVKTQTPVIPYGRQQISEEDIDAVAQVLRSDWLTQGPLVPAFEKAVAKYCNAGFGVAVNSATSALHIACLSLGVGKGDLVWTSPITFVASANCALYCGADVDFVDVDERTYNMSPSALEAKLTTAKQVGRLPKVVIPVHLSGQPCDMESIHRLSIEYGFKIIEDASHCIGGKYKNEPIGNCKYSSITVFSFHPVKIITTGEGGMAMTNDPALALAMAHYRSHGITRYEREMTHAPDGPWYYQQIDLGFNYRMTDISAALGLSQLKRLDEFVEKRHAVANRYNDLLKDQSWLTLPWQHSDSYSGYHLYIIRVKKDNGVIDHLSLFNKLRDAGILVNLHYIPIYHQPYYERMGLYNRADFPNAESYYEEAISLPMYPGLTKEDQDFVVATITQQIDAKAADREPKGFQNIF